MTEHQPLPVEGYKPQGDDTIALVNHNKQMEEQALQTLDKLVENPDVDKRWLAIGRTHLEQAYMAINRSIFKPNRTTLK